MDALPSPRASAYGDTIENQKLLSTAERGDAVAVEALLLGGQVDIDTRDADNRAYTPLHVATVQGHLAVVKVLLHYGATVDIRDETGQTPLHHAALRGHPDVLELLLNAGADANADATDGRTALHKATVSADVASVQLLLAAGADVHMADNNQNTPLHFVRYGGDRDVAWELLAAGASVHARDHRWCTPLHICLERASFLREDPVIAIIQVLALFGAAWDLQCDEMVEQGIACDEAPALHVCLTHWAEELAQNRELTEIPLEIIQRGPERTQLYLNDLDASTTTELRRKICVVGSSKAGKTSLIKSITSRTPSLEHADDRTIGINHILLRFAAPSHSSKRKTHAVTFWDFAGQDQYQVAHSLFFSKRTLYLVCIDVHAYLVAYLQAILMADNAKQRRLLMDEFVTRTILRWIRVICARHANAEFVFLATKHDVITDNATLAKLVEDDLRFRVQHIEGIVAEMRRDQKGQNARASHHELSLHEYRLRIQSRRAKTIDETTDPKRLVFVSCQELALVKNTRTEIEQRIVTSQNSFEMPENYARVLAAITAMKNAAASKRGECGHVGRVFVQVDELLTQLESSLGVDAATCRIIVETLHDLGDVLWYKDLAIPTFETTVILDPMLLIDFIRQVVNHNYKDMMMPHSELKGLPFWSALESELEMAAMKQLLQSFHLVYPTVGEMQWDSDLIVPAYWKSKTPAAWLFGDEILRLDRASPGEWDPTCERVRVHWEYHFEHDYPDALFDQLVVASHSPYVKLSAGPDWILFEDDGKSACRIMVSRDIATLQRTLRFEAVLSTMATDDQTADLWECFELLGEATERVLHGYAGLVVTRYAKDHDDNAYGLTSLFGMRLLRNARKWMPPEPSWDAYKAVFATLR